MKVRNVIPAPVQALVVATLLIANAFAGPEPPTPTAPGTSTDTGSTVTNLTPTLQWTGSSGADYYALAISQYPYGSGYIVYQPQQVYGTSIAVPTGYLQAGTKYRWNMQAHNSSGWSTVSSTLYFQTLLPASALSSPNNGATGVSTTPPFSWSQVIGANKYWLIVSTSQSALPTDPFATEPPGCFWYYTSDTSYTPSSALANNTPFYWEVQAFNDSVSPIWQGQYSAQRNFTTIASAVTVPTVVTAAASAIGSSSATLNAQISNTGGGTITERRFSWGTTPSCSDGWTSAVTINGNNFSYTLSGLTPGQAYYFQAWANNSAGWGSGSALSFATTSVTADPTVFTVSGTPQSETSALLFGTVNPNGLPTDAWFEWGGTASYGNATASTAKGLGTALVQHLDTISTLSYGATYHFRIVARNSAGTSYGDDASFTMPAAPVQPPSVQAGDASSLGQTSAFLLTSA